MSNMKRGINRWFVRRSWLWLSLFALAPNAPCAESGPKKTSALACYRALKSLSEASARPLNNQVPSLDELLAGKAADGPKILSAFGAIPEIRRLLQMDSLVRERQTVHAHTLKVFDKYNEQYDKFNLDQVKLPPDVILPRVLKAAIALHDVGKPAAIEFGEKERQHEFTATIVRRVFERAGFKNNEISLAVALVEHDAVGNCLRRGVTPDQAYGKIVRLAAAVGMSPKDFFRLQSFFYTVDAASYSFIEGQVFNRDDDGKLIIRAKEYRDLEALVEKRHGFIVPLGPEK